MNTCDPRIEDAIRLAMRAFAGKIRVGPTPVPASTHSIAVGLSLLKAGCDVATILAGFCHDMDEDTEVDIAEISVRLGEIVAHTVTICTIDAELEKTDPDAAELLLYERVVEEARCGNLRPLKVKCADSLDNLRTSKDTPLAWQISMLKCGIRWLAAGKEYLPGFILLEEFELVVNREFLRLDW